MTYHPRDRTPMALAAIRDYGPMTQAELSAHLGWPKKVFGELLGRLTRVCGPKSPQRLHVSEWRMTHPGARRYPRAVYAFGPGPNAPKPRKMSMAERERKSYARRSRLVASVFELGVPTRIRIGPMSRAKSQAMKVGTVSVRKVAE